MPPLLEWVAYRGLLTVAPLVLPELEKIAPREAIAGVPSDVPVLILAGGRDWKARPDEARAIHEKVSVHARLVVFEEADHVRLHATEPKRYERELAGFVQEVNRSFQESASLPTMIR